METNLPALKQQRTEKLLSLMSSISQEAQKAGLTSEMLDGMLQSTPKSWCDKTFQEFKENVLNEYTGDEYNFRFVKTTDSYQAWCDLFTIVYMEHDGKLLWVISGCQVNRQAENLHQAHLFWQMGTIAAGTYRISFAVFKEQVLEFYAYDETPEDTEDEWTFSQHPYGYKAKSTGTNVLQHEQAPAGIIIRYFTGTPLTNDMLGWSIDYKGILAVGDSLRDCDEDWNQSYETKLQSN